MIFNFKADVPHWKKGKVNRGEDAAAVSEGGLLIVCDGVGGSGSFSIKFNKAPKDSTNPIIADALKDVVEDEDYRWAYLGSRLCSTAAKKYLSENHYNIIQSLLDKETLCSYAKGLGKYIQEIFLDVIKEYPEVYPKGVPEGKKLFATTLTAVVFSNDCEKTSAVVFSAGDSHAKWWDVENGMSRISFGNASDYGSDSKMDGAIFGDRNFQIHFMSYPNLPPKGLIFACSDGVTDPLPPPKHEWLLVSQWLNNSNIISNREAYEAFVNDSFISYGLNQGDDCSLAGALVGYESQTEFSRELGTIVRPELKMFSDLYDEKRRIQLENNNPDEILPLYKGVLYKKLKNISLELEQPGMKLMNYISSLPDFRIFAERQSKALSSEFAKMEENLSIAKKEAFDEYIRICINICVSYDTNQSGIRGFVGNIFQSGPFGVDCLDKFFYPIALEYHHSEEVRKYRYNQYNAIVSDFNSLLKSKSLGELTYDFRNAIQKKYSELNGTMTAIFDAEQKYKFSEERFNKTYNDESIKQLFMQESENNFSILRNAIDSVIQKSSNEIRESKTQEFNGLFELLKQKWLTFREKEKLVRNGKEQNIVNNSNVILFIKDKISQIRDDIIMNYPIVFEELAGISFEEFTNKQKKIDINPYIEKLDKLWIEYKVKYEKFRTCNIYGSLMIVKTLEGHSD